MPRGRGHLAHRGGAVGERAHARGDGLAGCRAGRAPGRNGFPRWLSADRENRGRRRQAARRAATPASETSGAASPARTAIGRGARSPRSAYRSGDGLAQRHELFICACVRITTSHASPARSFSSIAPTAPKLPRDLDVRGDAAICTTSPFAAPALTKRKLATLHRSGFAPETFTTRAHFSMSPRMIARRIPRASSSWRRRPASPTSAWTSGRLHDLRDLGVQRVDDRPAACPSAP